LTGVRAATLTARAAGLLALLAVAALFVPVALAAGLAVILLGAAIADAWSVRTAPGTQRRVPHVLSRGVPTALSVSVPAADGRTVLLRQPATPELMIAGGVGRGALDSRLTGLRRGRHELPPVASASVGPLGLARVGHPHSAPQPVAVYPDLVTARVLISALRRELVGQSSRRARGPLGLGTDFESVREYTPDDDIRQLNWRATARLGRPMSNQFRLERDRELTCLIDCGRLMSAPGGEGTLLDVMLDAVTVLALAADELGDRCGAVAFDDGVRRAIAPGHRSGRAVVDGLFDLEPSRADSDFERAFARVGRSRRGLIAVFTDLVDEAAARSLLRGVPMLARRHGVLVVSAADPALAAVASPPGSDATALELASAIVARDVLAVRAATAQRLRRAGATVLEAPARELPARCLDAYLRLKTRGRV
jgi:uncharacterized protein (DUF58 family)